MKNMEKKKILIIDLGYLALANANTVCLNRILPFLDSYDITIMAEAREEEHNEMLSIFKYWGLENDKNSLEMISRRYIDRIIECLVNLFNSQCSLDKANKLSLISQYINTDNFNNSIKEARPKKFYLKILYLILKTKNISLIYNMSKFINFIKSNNIKLFSFLKTNR